MKLITFEDISQLTLPKPGSHKGQNGRLLIIGGSTLFHAASLWALEVASRIVDLVHYSSVPENNDIVMESKMQFRNGIVIRRDDVEAYIDEDDCILIGPGMLRDQETELLTHQLLTKYNKKQWVIDAGALQMLDLSDIPEHAILTPHKREFAWLWEKSQVTGNRQQESEDDAEKVHIFAKTYNCVVLMKGSVDIAASADVTVGIEGGNEGMTKGGTGDVLSGLISALACTNDPFLATIAGSYINKAAGDALHKKVGPFFNASDLAGQIPKTMKKIFLP